MEDFIKELQFLPKINFVSFNATDSIIVSMDNIEGAEDDDDDD